MKFLAIILQDDVNLANSYRYANELDNNARVSFMFVIFPLVFYFNFSTCFLLAKLTN